MQIYFIDCRQAINPGEKTSIVYIITKNPQTTIKKAKNNAKLFQKKYFFLFSEKFFQKKQKSL